MNKTLHLLCFLVFALTAAGPDLRAAAFETETEYLVVNNPRAKRFSYAVGNVTVGNPSIVDFRTDRKTQVITLFPKQSGSTLLIVYDTSGQQRDAIELIVYPTDPNRLLEQVRQLLLDVEGIRITRLDDKIVIDGEVILPSDRERIQKVVGNSQSIMDLTRLSPNTDVIIARKIQKEIGMDEVNVRSLKGRIILDGEVYSETAKAKASQIAGLYSDKVINVLDVRSVPEPPSRRETVQVTAHFVEVAKTFSRNFNFRWNPIPRVGTSLNYQLNPLSNTQSFSGAVTGVAEDLLPKLNYFRSLGVARVIENPTVSVKSGSTAVIESGTKLGFPVIQPNGTVTLDFQDVGAKLQITPYSRGSDVDVKISISVSTLGAPNVVGGVAISQSSIETSQFVRSGESVVIGGLVRYSSSQSIDRPPTEGGSTPASTSQATPDPFPLGSLFTLFKSNDRSRERSQFLIFVTPSILRFAKDANREIKDSFNLYEVYPERLDDAAGQKGLLQ